MKMEEEVVEAVLASHTPKNIEKGKQGQGERFQTGLGVLTQYLRRGRIY